MVFISFKKKNDNTPDPDPEYPDVISRRSEEPSRSGDGGSAITVVRLRLTDVSRHPPLCIKYNVQSNSTMMRTEELSTARSRVEAFGVSMSTSEMNTTHTCTH